MYNYINYFFIYSYILECCYTMTIELDDTTKPLTSSNGEKEHKKHKKRPDAEVVDFANESQTNVLTPGERALINHYLKKAKFRKQFCVESSGKYNEYNNRLLLLLVVLSTFNGSAGIVGLKDMPHDMLPMAVVGVIISFSVAIISGFQSVFKWSEKSSKYSDTAVDYSALIRKITTMLASGGIDRRIDCEKYMIELESDMNNIESTSPPIPLMNSERYNSDEQSV